MKYQIHYLIKITRYQHKYFKIEIFHCDVFMKTYCIYRILITRNRDNICIFL